MVGKRISQLWLFGGNSNNGSQCGLAYANSNNAWSNANENIAARLTKIIIKTIRALVVRHAKASGYSEPWRQVRMYSLVSQNNHPCVRLQVSHQYVSKSFGKLNAYAVS